MARVWKIGNNCKAKFPADETYAEAKIIALNGDFATVQHNGFFADKEVVNLRDLRESDGKEARVKQFQAAFANPVDYDSSNHESESDGDAIECDPPAYPYSPPSPPRSPSTRRPINEPIMTPPATMPQDHVPPSATMPQDHVPPSATMPQEWVNPPATMPQEWVNPPETMPQEWVNPPATMPQEWSNHPATMPQYRRPPPATMPQYRRPPPATMPQHHVPPPATLPQYRVTPTPPIPSGINDPTISSMLSAWYMAGYYAGRHSVQTEKRKCQCCCHSSNCSHY